MKKKFFIAVSLLFIIVTYLFLSAFYSIKKTDIKILNKCHTTKMNKVHLCPGGANYVSLNGVSKHFLDLIVIAEDASFYSHQGFDWTELKESFKTNLRALSYLRGGSTITQQLVKNVFLSPTKSLKRKFIEAMLAKKIEQNYSKRKILERYVNVIEFGRNIYGIKKASQHYFQKSPSQLNELESAFLVYLVPSPKKYSKVYTDKKLTRWSRKRISTLLRKLKNFKKISEPRYNMLLTKVDEFPWRGTQLHSRTTAQKEEPTEESADLFDAKPVIPEADEEELQEEIRKELEEELQ